MVVAALLEITAALEMEYLGAVGCMCHLLCSLARLKSYL